MAIAYPIAAGPGLTRVIESGAGEQKLLFIHGAGARADRWLHNLDALAAAGWHCYAVDLPGHGFASKGADWQFTLENLRGFLLAVVERLELGRYGLVGTSLGGLLAADLALHDAPHVASLTMVGSLGLEPLPYPVRAKIAANINVGRREEARAKLQRVVYDPSLVSPEWVEEEFRINTSPGAAESLAALGNAFLDDKGIGTIDLRARLARRLDDGLRMGLIWGTDDRSVSVAIGRRAMPALDGAAWAEIGHACHAPYLEHPDEFNRILLDSLLS